MLNIHSILKEYEPIELQEMDEVALMERVDKKFTVQTDEIFKILKQLSKNYRCLEINEKRIFSYQTEYLDNNEAVLFKNHQNGKLNRFKLRFRDYIQSNISFLEVKFKSNKGVTKKTRIEVPFKSRKESLGCNQFINKETPYDLTKFNITLINNFDRITLVNLVTKERVTIDINLKFNCEKRIKDLPQLCIIEVKKEKGNRKSDILTLLKSKGIRPTRFSKYAIGSVLLNPELKYNNFKRKLLFINKITDNGNVWNSTF